MMMLTMFAAALAAATPSAETELKSVSAAFDDAQQRKDGAAIDRFLAPDFKFIRGSGRFTDRNEFIAAFTDPKVKFDPFVVTNRFYVDLGPDAGIVGGEGTIRGSEDGKRFEDRFWFADTFRRVDGKWQVVYVQVTPLK